MAWWRWGSNFSPAGGVIASTRLRLAQGGFGPLAQLRSGGVLNGERRVQAVGHGQQALGKVFDAELACLGNFLFGTAPGVFGFGLGAQKLVGQIGAFGLELGQFGLQAQHFVVGIGCHCGFKLFGRQIRGWHGRVVVVVLHVGRLRGERADER